MCEVAKENGVLTLQPWRQHVRVEENSASKRSQEVNASWSEQSLEKILNVSAQDKSDRITITDEKGNSCRMLQENH